MSKKNRSKFRNREAIRNTSTSQSSSSDVSDSPVRLATASASAQHAGEYRIIRMDLIRLIILNAIILAVVFALYYSNLQSGFVERLYQQIF